MDSSIPHETYMSHETHESHGSFSIIHPDRRKPNYTLIGFGVTVAILILPVFFLIKTRANETHETPVTHETHISSDTPQNSLAYYITTSQQFLARAQTLSANTNQTEAQKQEIISEIQKSLDTINQGIKDYPNDDRGYSQRAFLYQTIAPALSGAKNKAIADLKKAVAINPQNPDYFRKLGSLYEAVGDLANSASAFYNAYTISPNDNQTLLNLASSLEKSGQIKKAVRYYDKLITLLPENDSNRLLLQAHKKQLEKLVLAAAPETLTGIDDIPDRPMTSPVLGTEELPLQQAAGQANLIIADPAEAVIADQSATSLNAKSGEGILPAGVNEIIIDNNNVDASSNILVIPADDIMGKNLFVKAKKAAEGGCVTGDTQNAKSDTTESDVSPITSHVSPSDCLPVEQGWFKVGIDTPVTEDLKFNWWVVD